MPYSEFPSHDYAFFRMECPAEFGELRDKRTIVIIQFAEINEREVRVTLSQLGWGIGPEWDSLYDYFDKAWAYVLRNLKENLTLD